MKNKNLLLTIVLCCIAASAFESCKSPDSINSTDRHASAQKKFNVYGVGFYNQENLFDEKSAYYIAMEHVANSNPPSPLSDFNLFKKHKTEGHRPRFS